jgi:type IV pilus assembly protein PilP
MKKEFIMVHTSKIILSLIAFGLVFSLFACDEKSRGEKKTSSPGVVSGTISQPIAPKPAPQPAQPEDSTPKTAAPEQADKTLDTDSDPAPVTVMEEAATETYRSQGKIDPFRPLIQETPEESAPIVDDRPKRILTPLEKIELSQIRLVAVILMKGKQIAMVEEAGGKGYEIGIGTYIGKNQGRVSEIKSSSIIVKELFRDYKGKLQERVQEIKLHKSDNEE